MTNRILGFVVWMLLLPGILGSWGGLAPFGFSDFNQNVHSSEIRSKGLIKQAVHQSKSCGSTGAEQESDGQEPNIPIQSPLFFSVASSASHATAVLSGASSPGSIINRFVDELKECRLHIFNEQYYTSRHVSRMLQRTLRLRTLFTCFMPAQAP